ncbi:aldehyde ferredoxin oxidoreductase family protein [Chloroflexota bacterium]
MVGGYMGKVMFADLSKGELKDEALDEKFCRDFIGGYGMGARIIYSRQKAGVDPLGPENILGIITGPFTGSPALSGTRYTVVGKSPLTGTWGDANSGGDFGPYLKFAGYDGLFFTGISPKPVYLFIKDGQAELRDAAHLWGKDSFDTEDILISELGKDVHVACIGPSGENLSLISCIMNNKGRAAGRSGLGAVMGSKKLKAVAVIGNMKIPIADEEKAKELRRKYMGRLQKPFVSLFKDTGTPGITAESAHSGDSPVKNWGGVGIRDFLNAKLISDDNVIDLQTKKYACWHCTFGCGGHMKAGTEYQYEAGAHKPEYETLCMFGANCLNDNLESIIKVNDICNRYGLDTISTGATISLAIECYENGLITKKDTDGIEMTWGNHKSIVTMTEILARREGFGAVLADGAKVAAERIGKGAEKYAIHIQGQELPAHDPKLGYHFTTTYRLDPTPGRHTQGHEGLKPPGLPAPDFDSKSFRGRGEAHKIASNHHHFMTSAGMCEFMYWSFHSADAIHEFINAITGWDTTMDEVLKTGERISNMRHAFNLREGLNPLQFKVPDRVLGRPPIKEGPLSGVTIDEDIMIKEYLTAMDWDTKTTKPIKKKLLELGLDDVAKDL